MFTKLPFWVRIFLNLSGRCHPTVNDAIPPELPQDMSFWTKYFELAVVPQMLMWIAFTMITGSLFGGIAIALIRRSKPAEQPA